MLIIGSIIFFYRHKVCNKDSNFPIHIPPVGLAVLIIIGLGWFLGGLGNYLNFVELRNSAANGEYEIVEGRVEQFVPMPYGGHSEESFVVNSQKFSYSDYDLTKGFNQTQSHGGPIREGLQVRIAHVNGKIVKLEIVR